MKQISLLFLGNEATMRNIGEVTSGLKLSSFSLLGSTGTYCDTTKIWRRLILQHFNFTRRQTFRIHVFLVIC